jgi:hypothetical protein
MPPDKKAVRPSLLSDHTGSPSPRTEVQNADVEDVVNGAINAACRG